MNTLVLQLGSARSRMALAHQPRAGGLLRWLRRLAPTSVAASHPAVPVPAIEFASPYDASDVPAALTQAWQGLPAGAAGRSAVRQLHVELGFVHARLGMVRIDAAPGSGPQAWQTMVEAWVEANWGLNVPAQVLRWQPLQHDSRCLLVSAVDRQVLEQLHGFAQRHGVRFTSCKPALATTWDSLTERGHPLPHTVAWLESTGAASRAPLVQLVQLKGHQPLALWRGLVTPPPADSQPDHGLQGAVARFQSGCQSPTDTPLRIVHWPSASA